MSERWSGLHAELESAVAETLLEAKKNQTPPAGVREALTRIELDFRARCLRSNAPRDASFDDLVRRIERLVDVEMSAHLRSINPAPTLNQIFANAHATSLTLGDERTRVDTKKCPSCGAARPENSQLSSCVFCGRSFFSGETV